MLAPVHEIVGTPPGGPRQLGASSGPTGTSPTSPRPPLRKCPGAFAPRRAAPSTVVRQYHPVTLDGSWLARWCLVRQYLLRPLADLVDHHSRKQLRQEPDQTDHVRAQRRVPLGRRQDKESCARERETEVRISPVRRPVSLGTPPAASRKPALGPSPGSRTSIPATGDSAWRPPEPLGLSERQRGSDPGQPVVRPRRTAVRHLNAFAQPPSRPETASRGPARRRTAFPHE
jgi:hypothetical protein